MVDKYLGRKYKLDHSASVKFDDYMKALGVNMVLRTIGNNVVATYDLTKEGDTYTLKSSSTFKNYVIAFKLGEEVEFETPDGRKVKATFTIDGTKLIEVQVGEKTTTITREFTDTELKCTMVIGDLTAYRVYRLVQ